MLGVHARLAAFLAIPMAVSIVVAVALAVHLPSAFPARHILVDGSQTLAVIFVFSGYLGVTWQLAGSYFSTDHPLSLIGVGLVAMVTTAILPVALFFCGLWWAGVPVGSEATDIVARLRSLFVVLPGIQAIVWGAAAAIGRLF